MANVTESTPQPPVGALPDIGQAAPQASPPQPTPKRRPPLVALGAGAAILLVLAGVVAALYVRAHQVVGIQASGTIQATQVEVAPKVPGRLEVLAVQDGDRVTKDQVLARLDQRDPTLELRTAQANLAAAQARLPQARAALALAKEQVAAGILQSQAGVDVARSRTLQADQSLRMGTVTAAMQIDQALAQLRSAQAARYSAQQAVDAAVGNAAAADANEARARSDYERAARLVADGAIPAQQFDAARAAFLSAQGTRSAAHAQVSAARSQVHAATQAVAAAPAALEASRASRRTVDIARLNVSAAQAQTSQSEAALADAQAQQETIAERERDVEVAQAAIAQARAAVDQARLHLAETALYAPFDGVILSHEAEVGDLIGIGAPVVTIADLNEPYMWVYVSETDLALVKLGQPVDVTVDGLPGRTIHGRVSEISGQAEFTPSNVQTKEERVELVFGVKVTLPNPDGLLKPGLPADAVIRTDVHSSG